MATITKFEDIQAWQDARMLAHKIYELTLKTPFCKDFSLIDQIRRSSGSIMDNIAEGFERDGNKEFIHFITIAKGSLGEVKSETYRAFNRNYITEIDNQNILDKATSIGKQFGGLLNYLKKSDYSGNKFKTVSEALIDYKS